MSRQSRAVTCQHTFIHSYCRFSVLRVCFRVSAERRQGALSHSNTTGSKSSSHRKLKPGACVDRQHMQHRLWLWKSETAVYLPSFGLTSKPRWVKKARKRRRWKERRKLRRRWRKKSPIDPNEKRWRWDVAWLLQIVVDFYRTFS